MIPPAPLWQRALEARLLARRAATAKARLVVSQAHRPVARGHRCAVCNRAPANFCAPGVRPAKALCRRHWLEALR